MLAATATGSNANEETILKVYPRRALANRVAILEPAEWSKEGWVIAAKFACGVDERTRRSDTYMKGLKTHCETQMDVAGYQLGVIFKKFFREMRRVELPGVVVCGAV
jgi:hypothetical protein